MVDQEIWKWFAGVFGVLATFLLKHFHGKISEAVSRTELVDALRVVAVQRSEDMVHLERDRNERRATEKAIFDTLREQDRVISRIDERTARMHTKLI